VSTSTVQWGGSNRTTTFVSSTQVTAAIPAADIDSRGVTNITVVSPAPGGGTSNALPFGVGEVLELVSVNTSGGALTSPNQEVTLAGGGRYVAFQAVANNVVPNDTNGKQDIVLRDTCVGAPAGCVPSTIPIALNNAGQQANDHSWWPTVSADGRYVVFETSATNMVTPDDNFSSSYVFLRDTCLGAGVGCTPTTSLVSLNSAGAQADSFSDLASISANGRYVAFRSRATNLVSGDTNNTEDVFLRDLASGRPGAHFRPFASPWIAPGRKPTAAVRAPRSALMAAT
jgi:hypothetical protein